MGVPIQERSIFLPSTVRNKKYGGWSTNRTISREPVIRVASTRKEEDSTGVPAMREKLHSQKGKKVGGGRMTRTKSDALFVRAKSQRFERARRVANIPVINR